MGAPRVALASLGGTIAMTPESDGGMVRPSLGADGLVAAVPQLEEAAEISTTTLVSAPSASLTFGDVLGVLDWAENALSAGAIGAVITQGTDTMEESAYLLDLHWPHPEPLVVTGAMRPPTAAGADGPANLLAAVTVASSSRSRERGVLVVMNDEVHAAVRVRKRDSAGVSAFHSPKLGPIGHVVENAVAYAGHAARAPSLPRPDLNRTIRVALVEACLDEDPGLLRAAVDSGYDGVVVAAFGAGHVSHGFAEAMSDVAERIPVVFASRTGAGTTLTRTYGFPGSEADLLQRGAIPAGWLDPRKARILLWSLLGTGMSRARIAQEFAARGRLRGGCDDGQPAHPNTHLHQSMKRQP